MFLGKDALHYLWHFVYECAAVVVACAQLWFAVSQSAKARSGGAGGKTTGKKKGKKGKGKKKRTVAAPATAATNTPVDTLRTTVLEPVYLALCSALASVEAVVTTRAMALTSANHQAMWRVQLSGRREGGFTAAAGAPLLLPWIAGSAAVSVEEAAAELAQKSSAEAAGDDVTKSAPLSTAAALDEVVMEVSECVFNDTFFPFPYCMCFFSVHLLTRHS
jgi:hypothetical protein|tara:strand:- start:1141 stop:1797 length:657 start_codon:yes stop_codon:yes gene_type:complete